MGPTFTPCSQFPQLSYPRLFQGKNSLAQALVLVPHQDGEVSDLILGCGVQMPCVEAQLEAAANFSVRRLHLYVQEVP